MWETGLSRIQLKSWDSFLKILKRELYGKAVLTVFPIFVALRYHSNMWYLKIRSCLRFFYRMEFKWPGEIPDIISTPRFSPNLTLGTFWFEKTYLRDFNMKTGGLLSRSQSVMYAPFHNYAPSFNLISGIASCKFQHLPSFLKEESKTMYFLVPLRMVKGVDEWVLEWESGETLCFSLSGKKCERCRFMYDSKYIHLHCNVML